MLSLKKCFFAVGLLTFVFEMGFAQAFPPCAEPTALIDLDINNVRTKITNGGDLWWDPFEQDHLYEVPKDGGISSIFSGGLWMGAIDEFGQLKVAAQWYRQGGIDFWAGPLDETGNTTAGDCVNYDYLWKLNRTTIDSFKNGLLGYYPINILTWPAKGNPYFAAPINQDLAPFKDVNFDGIYNPEDGDYPDILGDQSVWGVFNDKGDVHSESGGLPLGLEIQMEAYAFNTDPLLDNHTFYKYRFINKSNAHLDSMYVGIYVDVDLGEFGDDFLGCDTLRNMGIAYNGDSVDGEYGHDVPMLGVKILRGPQKADGEYCQMDGFRPVFKDWTITGSPENAGHFYYHLQSKWKDGSPLTYGGHGLNDTSPVTTYMYPSDPTDTLGWSECSIDNEPADRRFLVNVGVFDMVPGAIKELHFAVLWVRDSIPHPCPSFAPLQEAADYVQGLFDGGVLTSAEHINLPTHPSLNIYPNPMTEEATVILDGLPNETYEFTLYDILGKKVQSYNTNGLQTLFLKKDALQSGIYFYALAGKKGMIASGRLVIQ